MHVALRVTSKAEPTVNPSPLTAVQNMQHVASAQTHTGLVSALALDSDEAYLLSGGADRAIHLWSTGAMRTAGDDGGGPMEPLKTYSGHGYAVLGLDVGLGNHQFASCGGDRAVYLWDVVTGTIVQRFFGHSQRVNATRFLRGSGLPHDGLLASGSYDATVQLADLRAGGSSRQAIQVLSDAKDSVTALVWHGYQLLTSSVDGFVRTYDVRRGRLTTDNIGHPVTGIKISKDGHRILASALDSSVRLLGADRGVILQRYVGHQNEQYALGATFSASENHVAAGSEDGRVFVWNTETGKAAHEWQAQPRGAVTIVQRLQAFPEFVLTAGSGVSMWRGGVFR